MRKGMLFLANVRASARPVGPAPTWIECLCPCTSDAMNATVLTIKTGIVDVFEVRGEACDDMFDGSLWGRNRQLGYLSRGQSENVGVQHT